MLRELPPPADATETDWSDFVGAHRANRRARLFIGSVGAVVLAIAAIVAVLVIPFVWDRSAPTPPVSTESGITFADYPSGWTSLPVPPEVRVGAATAASQDQLFTWGGYVYTGMSDETSAATGFTFDAATGQWSKLPASPLAARSFPAAAWTGSEFIIWGGSGSEAVGLFFDDGAAYSPMDRTWRSLPTAPIGDRAPLSVWTGRELIVWGSAIRYEDPPRDGAAYDPATDSWRKIPDAPIGLTDATVAWTGEEMIVFGASLDMDNHADTRHAIGAAYNPATNEWRELPSSELSPQAHTAAWDGSALIAWDYELKAQSYLPDENEWRDLPRIPGDFSECSPRSVAVGNHVIGDYCGSIVHFDPASGWSEVFQRGPTAIRIAAGPVALLAGTRGDVDRPWAGAYRPGSEFSIENSISITPNELRPGDRVAFQVRSANDWIWGQDSELQRFQNDEWVRAGAVVVGPSCCWTGDWALGNEPAMRDDIGYGGSALMYLEIPDLEPGSYRLKKDFIPTHGEGREFAYAEFEVTE
jgi:hypothetical protein